MVSLDFEQHLDIPFADGLLLDLVRPAGGERLPAVIWLHGGAWRMQDRRARPDLRDCFASAGYVSVSIDYRLAPRATHPAQLLDVRAGLRYLRDHADDYGIDADRIGLWGSSAGGHLAALAGLTGHIEQYVRGEPGGDTSVQAVVDGYGPADLAGLNADSVPGQPEADLLGGALQSLPEAAGDASPARRAHSGAPPTCILHGADDELVDPAHSDRLFQALRAVGAPALHYLVAGFGHGFLNPGQVQELGPDHPLDVGHLAAEPHAPAVVRACGEEMRAFAAHHPHASFDTIRSFFDLTLKQAGPAGSERRTTA